MGTYDRADGTPQSPEEFYCEFWDEDKGCTTDEKTKNECLHKQECATFWKNEQEEGRSDFEAMQTRDDTQPYGEPEFGINIESGKRCRSCGRTNCEGGASCEVETERRK